MSTFARSRDMRSPIDSPAGQRQGGGPWRRSSGIVRSEEPAPPLPRLGAQHRNSLDFAELWTAGLQHDPPQQPQRSRLAQQGGERPGRPRLVARRQHRAQNHTAERIRVDTLRRADNVRGTGARAAPVSLKGADPQGKGAASDWGTSPTLLLARAWPGTPSPIQSYTRRGSMRSQSAWITALDLVSSRTRPGGLFLDSFLTHFGGVFGRFLAAPKSRTIPRPAGLTYCKIGSSPSRREGAPLDFFQAIDFFMRF